MDARRIRGAARRRPARGHLARDHRGGTAARRHPGRVSRQSVDPRRRRERPADRTARRRRGRDRASARLDPDHGPPGGLRAVRDPRRPDLRGWRENPRRYHHAPPALRSVAPAVVHAGLAHRRPGRCRRRQPAHRGAERHRDTVSRHTRLRADHALEHRVQGRARTLLGLGSGRCERDAVRARAARTRRHDRVAGIARATGDLERLLVDAQVAEPARGRVQAELRDLASQLTFRGKAEIESLDLRQWIDEPPVGPLAASLDIEGDRLRYAARGRLRGPGLPATGIGVDARASYSGQVVEFESIALESAPGLDLRAAGSLQLGDAPTFDVSATWNAFRWPLAGDPLVVSPRGSLEARGWTEFSYRVSGDFVPAQGPPVAGEASGRFTTAALLVDASSWRVLGGTVKLAGSLGRGDEPEWSASGRAAGIDPSKLRPNLPGKLGFEFTSSGRGFAPDSPWIVRIRDLNGVFRGQPIRGRGGLRRRPRGFEFEKLSVSLGSAHLEADGIVGRGANLEGRLVADNLSAILPELGGRVDATIRMRGRILVAHFRGHDLAYGSHRAVVLSVDARIDRQNLKQSWLRLRSNGISLGGFAIADTRLSLDGLMQDHALNFRVGVGQDAVSLRGRGGWQDERYTLAFEDIAASGPRVVPWKLASSSRLTASGRDATLEPVCLAYETRRFCFEGRWIADGEWSVAANTDRKSVV